MRQNYYKKGNNRVTQEVDEDELVGISSKKDKEDSDVQKNQEIKMNVKDFLNIQYQQLS